jgi:hypothetical protein
MHGFTPSLREGQEPNSEPGTDVVIFKIFSLKNFAKKLAFFTRNKANKAMLGFTPSLLRKRSSRTQLRVTIGWAIVYLGLFFEKSQK